MSFFNLFKKKKENKTDIAIVNHYFHGLIATKKTFEIDHKEKFISFDEKVRPYIFEDMGFIFFNTSNLREYLKYIMKENKYSDKIYFYSVCIHPITDKSIETTNILFKNNLKSTSIEIFPEEEKSLNISFIEDFTESISKGILPGIVTSEDLNKSLIIGYEEAFNKYFKPRVFEILSREENFGLIESAKSSLSEDVIAYIFYENYPNENWMVKFSKELIDNMVMNIPPTNIDIVSRNDSIYSDKKEE